MLIANMPASVRGKKARPRPGKNARLAANEIAPSVTVNQACRKASINPTTYYRWKALQEDPVSNEQLRMCELESEVSRLKTLVAELALDRRMLQEALKKKP